MTSRTLSGCSETVTGASNVFSMQCLRSPTTRRVALSTNEQQAALAISLRYFREAAPKHTADEDESLFPRLRRLRRPDLQPLLAKMDSLQRDHELAEKSHRKVDDLGRSWLANGRLSPQDAERLATVLRQLVELYCPTYRGGRYRGLSVRRKRSAFIRPHRNGHRNGNSPRSWHAMTSGAACDNLRKDHREMEVYLDRLRLLYTPRPRTGCEAQSAVREIRRLSAIHFEKRRSSSPRAYEAAFPDLMAQMDRQHDEVREVEQHVEELLSDPPRAPESRWLNDVRLFGTELYDLIQHHIVEEEDQLFRLAESRLTGEDQERLSAEMMKVYSRLSGS